MTTLFIIIAFIASILLTLFVLIQNPKGGGLAQNMGASSQLFGVQRTTDILEKGTWILIGLVAFCAIAITLSVGHGGKGTQAESKLKQKIEQATIPASSPQKKETTPQVAPIGATDPLKQ